MIRKLSLAILVTAGALPATASADDISLGPVCHAVDSSPTGPIDCQTTVIVENDCFPTNYRIGPE
jgi:hypothetical protein